MNDQLDEKRGHEEEQPRATFVILLLYLIVLIALWGFVYFTLLDRG